MRKLSQVVMVAPAPGCLPDGAQRLGRAASSLGLPRLVLRRAAAYLSQANLRLGGSPK